MCLVSNNTFTAIWQIHVLSLKCWEEKEIQCTDIINVRESRLL